jgi:hypothetical protein
MAVTPFPYGVNGEVCFVNSAPGLVSGTAVQLPDKGQDYMVYVTVTTSGTATSLTMGPTSAANAVTVLPSSSVTAGEAFSFRLPAGWWMLYTATTTVIAQAAVSCGVGV